MIEKTYVKTDKTLKRALAYFGKMQIEKIRPIHIQEFQQSLVQECSVTSKKRVMRPLSNNYIKQIFNKLRIFLIER